MPTENRATPRPPIAAAIALTGALFASVAAPPAAAQDDRFRDRADVVEVLLPVNVTLDGRPVRDLGPDNFQVFDGRRRVTLVDVDVVDLARIDTRSTAVEDGVPVAARRHFLLLFDLTFSDPGSIVKARQAARDLVATGLHASDLVAVAVYAERRGADLVLGFTSDRAQLEAALDSLGLLDPAERRPDPLKLVIEPSLEPEIRMGRGRTVGPDDGTGSGLNVDGVMLEAIRDLSTFSNRDARTEQINQVLDLSSSLEELAGYLASASGRKHVVYFSHGFDSSVVLGIDDQERLQEITSDAQFGELWRVDSDERFGNSAAQDGLFQMLERFRRCDCAIQAVDIGGIRAGTVAGGTAPRRASGENALFVMADQTGGELYRNYNNLSEAMARLLDRTSVTYMLAIAPENLAFDGAYHPVEVRLKGVPKRARLSYRAGYHAPKLYRDMSPDERRLATAERIVEGEPGGEVGTAVLAVPFAGRTDWAWVATLVEIDGFTLRREQAGAELPIELFAYAIDDRGNTLDYFTQGVLLDLDRHGPALDARGFKFIGHFDLPPGRYDIRVLARNAATGASGLARTRVDVPAFSAGEPTLLPPLFIEPDGLWLVGRERPRPGTDGDGYPLVSGGQSLIPATQPILPNGQSIPMLLLGHHLAAGELEASGRLLRDDGTPEGDVEIELESRGRLAGAERIAAVATLGRVAPGNYTLEVALVDPAKGGRATSRIAVTVY